MNEPAKNLPAPVAGGKTPAPANAPVAKPAVQPGPVAFAANSAPAAFGGHRGGGKKRTDGLVAGSPEAIEADKKKDRDRKNSLRAAKQAAPLPPPLPGAAAPGAGPAAPLADGAAPVPGAVAGAAIVAAPLFVPWSQKLLEKPARLLTKILDRLQVWSLMRHVRKLELTPAQEKEIEADFKWKEEVTADFSLALADCATVELNKRRVAGSQNSHWFNLAMSGGEMVMCHMQSLDRLEKMLLAKKAALTEEIKSATATSPANTAHYAKK